MKSVFAVLALLSVSSFSVSASEDKRATDLLHKVRARYRAVRTLSATLAWMTRLGDDKKQHTTYRVLLQAPNLFLMTNQSTGEVIASDGKMSWVYFAKQHQYIKTRVEPQEEGTLLVTNLLNVCLDPNVFSDEQGVPEKRAWHYLGETWLHHQRHQVIQSIVHKPDFQRETLYISADYLVSRDVLYTRIDEGYATKIDVTLVHPQFNIALPKATFAFKPPANAHPTPGVPSADVPNYDASVVVGTLPAALQTVDIAGKPLTLTDYPGKVVLLDYWASWCGPCVGEIPGLVSAYKKYHSQGLEIVSISLDDSSQQAQMRQTLKELHMTWPQICDQKGFDSPLVAAYKMTAIPFSLLIGRDGRVAAVNPRGKLLEPAIHAALQKK